MLKIIELEIDPELSGDTGVFEVAFVEYPAIEQDFVYFGKENFYKVTEEISSVACRAIRENEKRGNPAGTQVGKVRAQQLCNREEISLETVKRMKSFLERAATYYTGNYDDNGTIAYDLWGGKPALDWVDRMLKKDEEFQDDGLENACWEGYEPRGLKPAPDGSDRMVPNCVKIESSKEEFVYPQGGESQDDFIGRCISSSEMMGEFPDDSQRAAVCYSYWEKKGEFSFLKVSFDYDGVLTTEKGRNLLKQEIQRGNEVYIVSARNTAPSELQELVRELSFPPTKVYTVGSNINKIERIKSLGIERHYDDNLNVRRELGQVGINFDYDVSSLPDYQTTSGDTMEVKPFLSSDCGCSQGYELSQEQVDVFGYLTKNFDLCPGAISLFTHLTEMNMDEDTKGMVRSLAQIADNVFDVERLVMIRGYSTQNEIDMVKVLVGDFTDLLGEINELVGMNHDGSFMYDHLQLIESLYDDPSTWDEEERELFNSIQFLKENHPEKFEAVISGLNGATKQEVERRNHETPTNYFRYDIKVNAGPPDRSFCTSIEGRYFRRLEIDLLRDTNTQFGHNGQPYSKWLYKGGPLCKHAFRKFLVQGKNFADLGWVEGRPGIAPREMTGKGFYPGTPKYEASLSKNVISRSYMDENKFTECFGEFCNLEFTKTEQHLFKLNKEQRMLYTPLMIPNLLIPRMSENGDKYFVKFTPDAVERIQRKFMIEQRLRDTNYEHSDKKFQDIVMVESWLVNGEQDKSYTLGFTRDQIPVGTWMAGYKVLDTPEGDIVWNDYIKPGKVRGASVEGNFILNFSKERTDDYLLDEIIKILNKISE